ncbi:hypothetical protein CEXT_519681 [Caerostris extrusa]|uniref:Uncharacterized protein n=1 Tax=Caerostris extrusa TaxID=172846 RepID=A0AAV4R8G7_CAEEX|nr:hypothetical protein CEXT_519681 [Caerostris extrusa]
MASPTISRKRRHPSKGSSFSAPPHLRPHFPEGGKGVQGTTGSQSKVIGMRRVERDPEIDCHKLHRPHPHLPLGRSGVVSPFFQVFIHSLPPPE